LRHRSLLISEFLRVYVMSVAECLLDLAFVVDSSGSIIYKGQTNWDTALQFVANFSRQFIIGPDNVRIAFVIFSTTAKVEWGLTRYHKKRQLINAIRNVRYLGDKTNLNDALYVIRTQVFATSRGARPNATKAAIILTDGEDDVPVPGTQLTLQNATACKNAEIRLIAIGISNVVNRNRLLQIVSAPSDYHAVDEYNTLPTIVAQLQPRDICFPTPPPPTPAPVPVPSNVLHFVCSTHK